MNFSVKSKKDFYRKASKAIRVIEHWRIFRLQKRLGISSDLYLQLNQPWLMNAGIKTVLDIGAHTGVWARTVHHLMPEAKIYSFEPIPASFEKLQERMRGIPVHQSFNVALGESAGEAVFNVNTFPAASSLRHLSETHLRAFPFAAVTREIVVKTARLEDIVDSRKLEGEVLIKVDVQGSEDSVIRGGAKLFTRAAIVLIEVSFVPLYTGQPLFREIYTMLTGFGLHYAGNLDQTSDPSTGNILQADAIFLRTNLRRESGRGVNSGK